MSEPSNLNQRFDRLESKVDDLTTVLRDLVRVEERQQAQAVQHAQLDARVTDLAKANSETKAQISAVSGKVDQWVNRGVGLWGGTVALWAILTNATVRKIFFD